MFYFSLLKMLCPWLLQGDKIMQLPSWRDLPFFLIFERLVLSPFYPSFSRTLRYSKNWISFEFFLCFSLLQVTSFSSVLFSSFLDLLLLELIFLFLHFLWFFWTTSPLSFCIKNSSTFHFFLHASVASLCPPFFCSSICSSVVFFLSLFSVYDFFLKRVFDTSAFPKAFYLFVGHLLKFVCFCMFVLLSVFFFNFSFFVCIILFFGNILLFWSLSWTSVFPMFLLLSLLNVSLFFFWRFSLIWLYFSCLFFSFCILSFLFNNHVFFFFTKSWLLSPFLFLKKVLPPSSCFFTSSEKALSLGVCVDSFWNFHFWTLHIHLHQFNIFPFRIVYFATLFPPFLHPLSTCSLFCLSVFSRFCFIVRYF